MYGYLFLTAFKWITFKDDNNFKNLIIKSVVANYILLNIYNPIIKTIKIHFCNESIKILTLAAISVVLGLLAGKIFCHRLFNVFLSKINIGRTTNDNIWNDVIRHPTWLRVYMKDGTSYLGQYRFGETRKSEPIIVLRTYQKFDADTNILLDFTQDPNRYIMINTSEFEKIEIIYTPDNKK